MFAETIKSKRALAEVKSVQKQLSDLEQKLGDHVELKSTVVQLETEIRQILLGSERFHEHAAGLERATAGLAAALAVVESGDRAVPSQAIALYHESSEAMKLRMTDWNHVKTTWLAATQPALRQGNMTPIAVSEIAEEPEIG